MLQHTFKDRREAGRHLARELTEYANRDDVIVLALPRGGVPVGYEVASSLDAPLDVFLVRKLGLPGHEELAMGAIASGGVRVLNESVMTLARVDARTVDIVAAREQQELERRERAYRGDRPPPNVQGRTVILVDDGLATGSTMRAAALALREQGAAKLVVAVPVAAPETCDEFRLEVDEIVCSMTPDPFFGVGRWYDDFSQTTDEEVRQLLADALVEGHETIAKEGQMADQRASDQKDSGMPGGGQGRRDEVGGSGVYPASGAKAPEDAVVRTPGEWGAGAGGEEGGTSEIHFTEEELRAIRESEEEREKEENDHSTQ